MCGGVARASCFAKKAKQDEPQTHAYLALYIHGMEVHMEVRMMKHDSIMHAYDEYCTHFAVLSQRYRAGLACSNGVHYSYPTLANMSHIYAIHMHVGFARTCERARVAGSRAALSYLVRVYYQLIYPSIVRFLDRPTSWKAKRSACVHACPLGLSRTYHDRTSEWPCPAGRTGAATGHLTA
jgi:hypothetical protein